MKEQKKYNKKETKIQDKNDNYHIVVEQGDWSNITQLRQRGVPWEKLRTRNGLSALGMAIFEGSALATQMLIEMGAPLQSEYLLNNHYFSPLWSALEKKQDHILDILLQSGSDPNEKHPKHGYPIYYTSEKAMEMATILLCRHGAIPNINTTPSPLWLWIKHITPKYDEDSKKWFFPNSQVIIELLKSGAKINTSQSNIGLNELEFAKRQWLKHTLDKKSIQNINITISMMEKNLYGTLLKDIQSGKKDIIKKENKF